MVDSCCCCFGGAVSCFGLCFFLIWVLSVLIVVVFVEFFLCFSCFGLASCFFSCFSFLAFTHFFMLFSSSRLFFLFTTWVGRSSCFHFLVIQNAIFAIFARFVSRPFLVMDPVFFREHHKNRGFSVFPKRWNFRSKSRARMLAKVKCWPSFKFVFLGAEDGQHLNSKNAWFCRENKSFDKTGPKLGQHFNPTAYIYIYIYVYVYVYVCVCVCPVGLARGPPILPKPPPIASFKVHVENADHGRETRIWARAS